MVLKNEFHDILPGSSIREVYVDAERELDGAIAAGKAAQEVAMSAIAAQLPKVEGASYLVVNPTADAWRGRRSSTRMGAVPECSCQPLLLPLCP